MNNLIPKFLSVLAGATAQAGDVQTMPPRPNDRQPNILFLFTDDQRHDTIRALGNTGKRIVCSGGSLFGLPLAALDAVFHPLLVLNLMLFVAWANVMDVMEVAIPSFIVLPVLLLVLWGNVHVYRASLGTMESGKPLARALRVPAIVFVLIFAGLLIWAKRGAADRVTRILEEHRQQQENLEAEIERAEELRHHPEDPE